MLQLNQINRTLNTLNVDFSLSSNGFLFTDELLSRNLQTLCYGYICVSNHHLSWCSLDELALYDIWDKSIHFFTFYTSKCQTVHIYVYKFSLFSIFLLIALLKCQVFSEMIDAFHFFVSWEYIVFNIKNFTKLMTFKLFTGFIRSDNWRKREFSFK